MTGWLKSRLSPVKSETQRWIELAEANETFWAALSDPGVEYLRSLRSIFSAAPAGRALLLRNMGGYFEDNLPDDNVPIAVLWRKHELLMKQTTVPLENLLLRVGSEAEWEPLWALSSDTYGAAFYIASELPQTSRLDGTWKINGSKKLWPMQYMTSRGVMAIDLNAVRNYADHEVIRHRAAMLRPAHIVFDGFRYLGHSEVTLVANTQPRLDGTWKISSPTNAKIKSYPLSHDDMMSKSVGALLVLGQTMSGLQTSTATKPVRVIDNGNTIDFVGVAQNGDFVGSEIGAAGLRIGGVIMAPFHFLKKQKASDDSFKIKITLRFR